MTSHGAAQADTAHRFGPVLQFALLAGPLLSMLDSSIVNVAVAPIAHELNATLAQVQWTISGYLLALGTGLAATSYLARRFGTLPVYRASVIAFTAASVACALAPTIDWLIAARVLQGLAGAPMVPLAMSMLLGKGKTTRAMSPVAGMLLFLGPALGPTLGGILIAAGGWRTIFLINLPIGALAAVATIRIPRSLAPGKAVQSRFDLVGLVLLATGLTALLYGASDGESRGWGIPGTWMPLALGAALLVAYVWWASRTEHRALDLSMIRNRVSALALMLCAFASVVTYGTVFLLPVFVQSVQGHTAFATGLTMLPQGILTGVSMALGQRRLTRISVRMTVIIGFTVLALSSLGLLAIGEQTPLWVTALILACRAASLGLVITPLLTAMLQPIRENKLADANTLFSIWQRIAGSFGIGLIASLFATRSVTDGPVSALHTVGLVLAGLSAVAMAVAVLLPKVRNTALVDR